MNKVIKNLILTVCATCTVGLFIWLSIYGYKFIKNNDEAWWPTLLWLFLAFSQTLKASSEDSKSGGRVNFRLIVFNFGLWLVLGVPFVLLIIGMFVGIRDLFVLIIQIPATKSSNTASLFLVLILGWILFKVRQHLKYFYGLGEVMMGLTMAYFKFPFELSLDYSLALMAGSVYLIVRGLDNMEQGKSVDKLLQILSLGKLKSTASSQNVAHQRIP